MKLKFNSDLEIKPKEWILITTTVIAIALVATGNIDKAVSLMQSCWQWLKK